MIAVDADVLILGSGFGGTLTALLARQIGLRPVLVDRGRHPRFAIGESSTPLTNLLLEDLARQYGLPRLVPLANYADWCALYPEVMRGLKRGFSYFPHEFGRPFQPRADHANELLVAASYAASDADTHWLRADVDHFLVKEALAAGIPLFEETVPDSLQATSDGWVVQAARHDELLSIHCRFLVDATGDGGWLPRQLGLIDATATLQTHSRAVFAHFTDLKPWEPVYRGLGGLADDHPYPCDAAALHHVFDGGWMYQLRFDSGITSAGFCLDPRRYPTPEAESPEEEWAVWLDRLPSVREQLAGAKPVSHGGRIVRSKRLQRRFAPAAGPNWALLPHAAGFIDPLHSTGIAHTLFGIDRLVRAWDRHWQQPPLAAAMQEYDRLFQAELSFTDRLVAASYAGFADFERMVAVSMFYFATAIWSEHRRRAGTDVPRAFLCADEPHWSEALDACCRMVRDPHVSAGGVTAFVRGVIAPVNLAGLCDPARRNLYPYPPPR
jgi:FADH2 O2-dependent halogenase